MIMNTAEIITAIAAVFGIAFPTYTYWKQSQKDNPFIRVKLKNGFLTFHDRLSDLMLFVSALNPREKTVHLTSVGLILPTGQQVMFIDAQGDIRLPYSLKEGKSCNHWIDVKSLASNLRQEGFIGKIKIQGFYLDALENMYKSNQFTLDIDEWADN